MAAMRAIHNTLKTLRLNPNTTDEQLNSAKAYHDKQRATLRSTVRLYHHLASINRDQELSAILSSDPSKAYRSIKSAKATTQQDIQQLNVNGRVYLGN